MAKKMAEKRTFEASLKELEGVVKKLESGKLSLEESLVLFENGVKLYKDCKSGLERADKKMAKLTSSLKEEDLAD